MVTFTVALKLHINLKSLCILNLYLECISYHKNEELANNFFVIHADTTDCKYQPQGRIVSLNASQLECAVKTNTYMQLLMMLCENK